MRYELIVLPCRYNSRAKTETSLYITRALVEFHIAQGVFMPFIWRFQ